MDAIAERLAFYGGRFVVDPQLQADHGDRLDFPFVRRHRVPVQRAARLENSGE
ncbi:hypothetical protein OKW41_004308 [Paraburkholderia sp. UCT70]|uniref:hypothetical protein n=1 Tax=Paraburkholderia sp. UCT70 TaxID=2991068 RepID=UPI003D1D6BA7